MTNRATLPQAAQASLLDDVLPDPQAPAAMARLVRPRLAALLAEAQAARVMPWAPQVAEVNAILFHNMANWLPAPERDQLRAAFRAEMARLGTA